MTRQLDSGALTELATILKLGGGGEQTTQLDDGNVSQVLDVNQIVRRSLTFASTTGLWYFRFRNVHVAGGVIAGQLDPYAVSGGINSYPTTLPRGVDAWLLYAVMQRSAGAGALTSGILVINMQTDMQGKGSTGASMPFAIGGIWESIETITGLDLGVTAGGESMLRGGFRLRRGINLQFRSNAAAAATFDCNCVIGVFPSGLGQDVVT